MSTIKGMGLKAKLLLSILFIIAFTTTFNLIYTYKTFKSDKEAYIYESAERATATAIEKFNLFIQNIIKNAQTTKSKDLDKNIFKVLNLKNGRLVNELNNSELDFDNNKLINFSLELSNNKQSENSKEEKSITLSKLDNNALLVLKDKSNLQIILLNMSEVNDALANDQIFKYAVVGNNSTLYKSENLNLDISDISDADSTQFVKNYLTSSKSNPIFNLKIISAIEEDKAFSVIEQIIYKNIAFAVIILGVCIIITVLFSNSLISPILRIIDKTKEIAAGNYDSNLKVTSNDELASLGKSINSMSSEIKSLIGDKEKIIKELEVANQKLDDYSKNLEIKVQERTRELKDANDFIKTMINSLDQGLFVFDKENNIKEIYTKACEDLFDMSPANHSVWEVLKLNDVEKINFTKWSEILFANKLPFDIAKVLGPKKFIKGEINGDDFKHVEINYFPMQNDNNELLNVVAVATDKTDEMIAKESFKKKDEYVSMIMKIIKNKTAFNDLISESQNLLNDLEDFKDTNTINTKALMTYHTLFGGLSSFNVYDLAMLARANEEKIKDLKELKELKDKPEIALNEIKSLTGQYKEKLSEFYNETMKSIGAGENIIEVESDELKDLAYFIEKSKTSAQDAVTEFFNKRRIKSYFGNYNALIESLANKLDKPMNELIIDDSNLRVDPKKYTEFFSTLIHLFRNCMDHGIESSYKREETGKDAKGTISVIAKNINNGLQIVIADDGAGINTAKVRQKLETILGKEKVDLMSDDEVNLAIYLPELSTAEELTELSGRGVGMSAIKDSCEKIGGIVKLETKPSAGSKFIFEFPQA